MRTDDDDSVTRWLQRWRDGDALALERLLPLVYADLRRIAASALRGHHGHATLQPTALVHEVMLRLLGAGSIDFADSAHWFNSAARMMRQILVDRARAAAAGKRGGDWVREEFTDALELPLPDDVDLITLDAALDELEQADARMAQVVQLRYFVGLGMGELAAALGISERTAQRDWIAAREWLRERL